MSARFALVVLGAVAVAVPVMRRDAPAPTPAVVQGTGRGSDTARVHDLLEGVRGAPPVACDLAVRWADVGWSSDHSAPDADPRVAELTRSAGARVDDPLAVPPLVAALDDPDRCVQRMALRLLGRSRLPAALTTLRQAVGDPRPARRAQGAIGLGLAGRDEDLPRLITLLRDADPGVREAAAWAIGALH